VNVLQDGKPRLKHLSLPVFEGMADVSERDISSTHSFAVLLLQDQCHQAKKSLRNVRDSERVWKSAAKGCLASRRIELATECLLELGLATVVMEIATATDPLIKLKLISLALGDLHQALEIVKTGDTRETISLYQHLGQHRQAVNTTREKLPIWLKSAAYQHAKHQTMEKGIEILDSVDREGLLMAQYLSVHPDKLKALVQSHDSPVSITPY
jgi:hypothetical protein